MPSHDSFDRLSDQQLVEHIDQLALQERRATASPIASLAELDARGVHFALGYTSLFAYCRERLHLSEHAALNRIEAARAGRAFPIILERLAEGALTLTAVRLLRPLLTRDNHADLIEQARHMGKQEVQEVIARLRPQPPVPSTIRKLPDPKPPVAATAESPSDAVVMPPPPTRRTIVAPLSEETYKVQFTIRKEAHDKLRRLQGLLRHQSPKGDPALIFERAMDALLADVLKKRTAAVEHPRNGKAANPASRHVPARVTRAVWARDGGACAFTAPDGHRCGEKGCLEIHHVVPYAAGGKTTLENLELRGAAHNRYEAEQYFGERVMSRFRESPPAYAPREWS